MEEHFLSNIFVNDALLNLTVSSCRDNERKDGLYKKQYIITEDKKKYLDF